MRLSLSFALVMTVLAACTPTTRLPSCGNPPPPVVNPRLPDGGIDDAGVLGPGACAAACGPLHNCNGGVVDGGDIIIYCSPCSG